MSKFAELVKINVNEHVEKKGKLSYLSWPWALTTLMEADPEASWCHLPPVEYEDKTMMVFCQVTCGGVMREAFLPVMDYKNKAIVSPSAFDINTAMQRCFVKAIALHGLGLYIYAGEDLPEGDEPKKEEKKTTVHAPNKISWGDIKPDRQTFLSGAAEHVKLALDAGNMDRAVDLLEAIPYNDEIEEVGIMHLFNSAERSAMKAIYAKRKAEA